PRTLLLVARYAADDHVLPRRLAAERAQHDVIVGCLRARDLLGAVLAASVVARVDVLARELRRLLARADDAQKADHRRHLALERHRSDEAVLVLLDDLHLAVEEQRHGSLPRDASHRLVAGSQYQSLHGSASFLVCLSAYTVAMREGIEGATVLVTGASGTVGG